MELADLENLIKSRRSVRAWRDEPVPEHVLTRAVEAATWAPNGGNQQNWRFYVILDRKLIVAIADAVQARADEIAAWPESSGVTPYASRRPSGFFRSAPAAIAIASSQYQSPLDRVLAARERTDARAREVREWRRTADTRIQSAASAIAYLLLLLHQAGLGAVWMTGPIQAKGEIERLLNVPDGLDLVAFIPVGYPAESPPAKDRRPLSEVCTVIR